jgi:hypothetical protein
LNSAVALTPFNSVRYRYRLGSRKRYVYITWWLERETGWVWEVEARWEDGAGAGEGGGEAAVMVVVVVVVVEKILEGESEAF